MQNKTDDPLERQGCPVCGSYDLECYREDHIDWYDAAGYVGALKSPRFSAAMSAAKLGGLTIRRMLQCTWTTCFPTSRSFRVRVNCQGVACDGEAARPLTRDAREL